MLKYLKFLLDEKIFSKDNFDHKFIVSLLTKDHYINRLILNFYYLLDIHIPDEFLKLYNDHEAFKNDFYDAPGYFYIINDLTQLTTKSYC